MVKVYPLIEGIHNTQSTPEGVLLPSHKGAVTLLQSESKNILVDVGGRGTFENLKNKLKTHKIRPDEIDVIILTHLHLDHSYNIAYFKNARVLAWNHEWMSTGTMRFNNIEEINLPKGIKIIKSPGHAQEHLAVLVDENKGKTAIVGDAFNEKYLKTGKISTFCSNEKSYHESAKKILSIAKKIIPGHGKPFFVEGKFKQ